MELPDISTSNMDKTLGTSTTASSSSTPGGPNGYIMDGYDSSLSSPIFIAEDDDGKLPTKSSLISLCLSVIGSIVFHTTLCLQLFLRLFLMLLRGTRTWVFVLGRLVLFTIVLMPGFAPMLNYYFFSPSVIKNISYGKGAKFRNLLDVYLPVEDPTKPFAKEKRKVIIFVSGGAWTIGYKLWSCLVARAFSFLGYLVIVPDYRNFPQGRLNEMKEDVRQVVAWTYSHCHLYDGDKHSIVLAGQSAGAHICLSALAEDCTRDCHTLDLTRTVKLFVGISGAYNLTALKSHLHNRGLDASILSWVCYNDLTANSPYAALENMTAVSLRKLPPVALFHGSRDVTIPSSESSSTFNLLYSRGKKSFCRVYSGWTHTDAILEAPMTGDWRGLRDISAVVEAVLDEDRDAWERIVSESDAAVTLSHFYIENRNGTDEHRAFAPLWLGLWARRINPF